MKITDTLITTLLKHGLMGEMKNFKTEVVIPPENEGGKQTKITITADNLQVKFDTKEDR